MLFFFIFFFLSQQLAIIFRSKQNWCVYLLFFILFPFKVQFQNHSRQFHYSTEENRLIGTNFRRSPNITISFMVITVDVTFVKVYLFSLYHFVLCLFESTTISSTDECDSSPFEEGFPSRVQSWTTFQADSFFSRGSNRRPIFFFFRFCCSIISTF